MLPASAKNKIEQIWLDVIAGGVSQPDSVIEQLTYLIVSGSCYFHAFRCV